MRILLAEDDQLLAAACRRVSAKPAFKWTGSATVKPRKNKSKMKKRI
jgi:hypothetical protein